MSCVVERFEELRRSPDYKIVVVEGMLDLPPLRMRYLVVCCILMEPTATGRSQDQQSRCNGHAAGGEEAHPCMRQGGSLSVSRHAPAVSMFIAGCQATCMGWSRLGT